MEEQEGLAHLEIVHPLFQITILSNNLYKKIQFLKLYTIFLYCIFESNINTQSALQPNRQKVGSWAKELAILLLTQGGDKDVQGKHAQKYEQMQLYILWLNDKSLII